MKINIFCVKKYQFCNYFFYSNYLSEIQKIFEDLHHSKVKICNKDFVLDLKISLILLFLKCEDFLFDL